MSLLFTNNFKVLQKGGLSVALINPYLTHYENMPMQYIENFLVAKIEIFIRNVLIFFLFLLQNIDCGYSLEPPRRGGSNEYPQSKYTPAYPSFTI